MSFRVRGQLLDGVLLTLLSTDIFNGLYVKSRCVVINFGNGEIIQPTAGAIVDAVANRNSVLMGEWVT
jgi:hypothetical protein